MTPHAQQVRHLVVILPDQLNRDAACFDDFSLEADLVWMAETDAEARRAWSHQQRVTFFFSAMRHFRDDALQRGYRVSYHSLDDLPAQGEGTALHGLLNDDLRRLRPEKLVAVMPGDHAVAATLKTVAERNHVEWELRPDRHFYLGIPDFAAYASEHTGYRLETFYRHMRRREHILINDAGSPAGGDWNYDKENRKSFGSDGPGYSKVPRRFQADELTRAVQDVVKRRFRRHPGNAAMMDLPVTREQALALLRDFIDHRLTHFGPYQDAMWKDRPFLHHSRLSAALNAHLLSPGEVVSKAVEACRLGHAPINSVEGFVRQVLGWREFVRGIYWREMPDYADRNALGADLTLPSFYWTGTTGMACVHDCMRNVLEHGYAHHIQRLMVLGLLALLLGVDPHSFHRWHMAMYLDAADWVSLPNVLGMSLFADGGLLGSKPYCASGKYISRMSNYCVLCRYDPAVTKGEEACPYSVLYWDFLARHRTRLQHNRRMQFQLKNLDRKPAEQLNAIRRAADKLKEAWG